MPVQKFVSKSYVFPNVIPNSKFELDGMFKISFEMDNTTHEVFQKEYAVHSNIQEG